MPFELDYPLFGLSGYMMDLKFRIGGYVRTRPASIHYATFCSGNSFQTRDVVGAVGLSVSDMNSNSIVSEENMYSVYLNEDGTGGELIFGQDPAYISEDWNVTIKTNQDWVPRVMSLTYGPKRYDLMHSAIFDLSLPFIGVPAPYYREILHLLKETYLLNCQWDKVMPECVYPDDLFKFLPNLTIGFWSSRNYLDVPASVYLKKFADSNRYQLLLVGLAIDPHTTDIVPVTPKYVNYSILGYPFLRHFYTVFNYADLANPTVTVYRVKPDDIVPDDDSTVTGITIGAIILGVIVLGALIACFWAVNRSRAKAAEQATRERAMAHPVVLHQPPTEIREPLVTRPTLVAQ